MNKRMQNGNVVVTLAVAVTLVLVGVIGYGLWHAFFEPPEESFAIQRSKSPTKLTTLVHNKQPYSDEKPPNAQVVHYTSSGNKLLAWLILPPKRKGKVPAVVFAHGGFALGKSDFDDLVPFIKHGYAVMLPTWRGENGNPGNFEMCRGEVDDLLAAIDWIAKRPEIDNKQIYGAGHSIGATNMMLAAELSDKLRKVAVSGGMPDMAAAGEAYEGAPFNEHDHTELVMRSPAQWVRFLNCPLLLIYGGNDDGEKFFAKQAEDMKSVAQNREKVVQVDVIPGADHFTALAPAVNKMILFFGSN